MNCERVREMFSDLHDGMLDSETTGGVQGHVQECGACRAEKDEFLETMTLLSGLGLPQLPMDFASSFAARLEREDAPAEAEATSMSFQPSGTTMKAEPAAVQADHGPARPALRRWTQGAVLAACGAAAALLLLWGLGLVRFGKPETRRAAHRGSAGVMRPGKPAPGALAHAGTMKAGQIAVLTMEIHSDANLARARFEVVLPDGLAFVGEDRQVYPEKMLSWAGRLEPGKNRIRIPVKAVRPGKWVLTARARGANVRSETRATVTVSVQTHATNPAQSFFTGGGA